MRCFPSCLYCLELCNSCMGSTATSSAVPIYDSIQGNIMQLATACDLNCTEYLTSADPMPVILYRPKQSDSVLPVLRACTNGAPFGLIKVKFIIHYIITATDNQISIWCQLRSANRQEIFKVTVDNNFKYITEFPANFASIFPDTKEKGKLAKILKDIWCYFNSLLAKPVFDCQLIHTQENGKVDDYFEYYATMCVDPSDIPPDLSSLKKIPVYMHP